MHLSDGIITSPALIGGTLAAAAAGSAWGLYRLKPEEVPRTAMMSAAFFTASLIHLPLPGSSVHLLLPGLLGVVLGWAAFPAILVALLLQSVLFGHGGLTALGANALCQGVPAVACYYLFQLGRAPGARPGAVRGFVVGALGVLLAAGLCAGLLTACGDGLRVAATVALAGHVPVAVIEGVVTAAAVTFLARARPEVLAATLTPTAVTEGDG